MGKMKVGIIGAGNISDIYLQSQGKFEEIEIGGIADLYADKAKEKADAYGVPFFETTEELLASPEIGIILNLTIPKAHAAISRAALENGKHVYSEKPLAISFEDAKQLVALAEKKNLRIGIAPDTILGAGIQTAKKAMEEGMIGRIVGAKAFMMGSGPESWHPNPDFFYEEGAGPLFDMGPYYLSALFTFFGPADQVVAIAQTTYEERTIGSAARLGEKVPVKTPTHVEGILRFKNNQTATITTTFDIYRSSLPFIEVYGNEGTIKVPDPNFFGGPVQLLRTGESEWRDLPLVSGLVENERGVGLANMIASIEQQKPHVCNGEFGLHVVETMEKLLLSSAQQSFLSMTSTFNPVVFEEPVRK